MVDEIKNEGSSMLQDGNGNTSSMRVMSFVSLIASLAVASSIILRPINNSYDGLYIFTAFLVAAFAPKAIQSFAENLPNLKK